MSDPQLTTGQPRLGRTRQTAILNFNRCPRPTRKGRHRCIDHCLRTSHVHQATHRSTRRKSPYTSHEYPYSKVLRCRFTVVRNRRPVPTHPSRACANISRLFASCALRRLDRGAFHSSICTGSLRYCEPNRRTSGTAAVAGAVGGFGPHSSSGLQCNNFRPQSPSNRQIPAFVKLTEEGVDDVVNGRASSIGALLSSESHTWDGALLSRRQISLRLIAISIICALRKESCHLSVC